MRYCDIKIKNSFKQTSQILICIRVYKETDEETTKRNNPAYITTEKAMHKANYNR